MLFFSYNSSLNFYKVSANLNLINRLLMHYTNSCTLSKLLISASYNSLTKC